MLASLLYVDPAAAELDEEEDVEPGGKDGVNVKEGKGSVGALVAGLTVAVTDAAEERARGRASTDPSPTAACWSACSRAPRASLKDVKPFLIDNACEPGLGLLARVVTRDENSSSCAVQAIVRPLPTPH